ncbi:hypothetical protein J8F10_04960 [Gemmata sp. G18]|uniref:Carboxypeptidase regulatory-like domain-containing protein n=1 Tax=Gemmata palustris TaxID=2822762 RepID=A0ABS5BLP9_9BACT|nr:hypothetical protein [Gemmata palustris]MBP3954633.1 hypothetical protein [Gemmata palustris]
MLVRTASCLAAFVLGASLLAGCGTKPPEVKTNPTDKEHPTFGIPIAKGGTSTVSGKATLNGEPLTVGRVLLFTADGLVMSIGTIDATGSYKLTGAPDGPASAVVLLDPDGKMPIPTGGSASAGPTTKGGPPGGKGGPMKGPPGGPPGGGPPRVNVIQPFPAPFLEQLKFTVPAKEQARYKAAHAKYGQSTTANPLKLTVSGDTTFDLILTN